MWLQVEHGTLLSTHHVTQHHWRVQRWNRLENYNYCQTHTPPTLLFQQTLLSNPTSTWFKVLVLHPSLFLSTPFSPSALFVFSHLISHFFFVPLSHPLLSFLFFLCHIFFSPLLALMLSISHSTTSPLFLSLSSLCFSYHSTFNLPLFAAFLISSPSFSFSPILLFIQPQPPSPSLLLYVSLSPAPPSFFYLSLRLLLPPSPGLSSRLRLLGECYYSITLHLDNHRLATPNWSGAGGGG